MHRVNDPPSLSLSLCWPVRGVKSLVSYHNVCAGSNSRNHPAGRVKRLCGSRPPPPLSQSCALSLFHFNTSNAISHSFHSFSLSPSFYLTHQCSVLSHFHCLSCCVSFSCFVFVSFSFRRVSPVGSTTSSMGYTLSVSLFSSFLHHTHPPPPPHLPPPPLSLHSPASTPCL